MAKYSDLVAFIIKNVGDKENVISVSHCMTRLRFKLKDYSLVDEKNIISNSKITTAQKAGGEYQVVVGTIVEGVFTELIASLGLKEEEVQKDEKDKSVLNRVIQIITKSITPVLGILMASGLIQGLLALLVACGALEPTDGAYVILSVMGNALFTFFPIFLGYTSAKAFRMDGFVGMAIGACLVFPTILTSLTAGDPLFTLFSNSILETPVYKTFFGIPIIFPTTGYTSTVVPIIVAMYFTSKFEKFLKKHIPDIVAFTLVPFLSIAVCVPLTILAIGPIANILSLLVTAAITYLNSLSPVITSLVVGIVYQPLVILGLHWPLITVGITNMGALGYDYIIPMIFTASFTQTAVVLAVYFKTKDRTVKNVCIPAMISGCFCIIEPAIYGVTLPVKKRFGFSMIGATVGAIIISIFGAKMYAVSVGVLGTVAFINPNGDMNGFFVAIVATIISMMIAFLLTFIFFNEQNPQINLAAGKKPSAQNTVVSPFKGKTIKLENIEDASFSKGVLGKGIAILPTEGRAVAPCDGIVTALFPTGHAIAITSDDGCEILIHVGLDTVRLNGKYFTKKVQQGAKIKKGDVLVEFDIEGITKEGYSLVSPIIITNSDDYFDIIETMKENVDYFDQLIRVVSKENELVNQWT
ncbi:MAG: glucose transporter subunit [Bacillota bacterium]|jgi:PTS system beta-glucosides-specific IIC component|nr:glucose transporter subunit [Bacillota bacterium]